MPNRKIVMISSTIRDLPRHREGVRLACERAGFDPREMMENLTAEDSTPLETSLRMVAGADVYVCILGHKYGACPPGVGKSLTEMEYDEAERLGKPKLVFFIDNDHELKIGDVDTGEAAEKLAVLKDRIGTDRVAAFFKSPDDLRAHVVESLTRWGRAVDLKDEAASTVRAAAALHRSAFIPAPPKSYVAHPYTLLQTRELVGRQDEINALTDWVANPQSSAFGASIFSLVAIGGMGKSALTWKWFNDIAPNEMKPLAGRMWWSFYESDASFEKFLNRALCYLGRLHEEDVKQLPWHDREELLLKCLNEKAYLIVLDGLERILIAYNRMDASSLADDEYDEKTANYVIGAGLPSSAAQSFVGQHQLRRTTDARAGALLVKLAGISNSRILVTTRLYPSELQLPTGERRPGCAAYFLPGLSDDDALSLWRNLGVSGSRDELLRIFNSVQNHPLLVQALASEIANYRPGPGDFSVWRTNHPSFDPTSLPLVQSRSHILSFALKGLSPAARDTLSMIVGFRMPATYLALEALLVGPGKACDSCRTLDRILAELEDRGLIGWDRDGNRYDSHPIVRGVAWGMTSNSGKMAVYSALEAHFESIEVPNQLSSLNDLDPIIERYHTLIGLNRHSEAYKLFKDRLRDPSFRRFSAHKERIQWLEQLFPNNDSYPILKGKDEIISIMNSLGASYLSIGLIDEGMNFLERAYRYGLNIVDIQKLAAVMLNICEINILKGNLYEAKRFAIDSLVSARKWGGTVLEASVAAQLGTALSLCESSSVDGMILLQRARNICEDGRAPWASEISALLSKVHRWNGRMFEASVEAEAAWTRAFDFKYERDFTRAALVQGQVSLALSDTLRAEERLNHALIRARTVNLIEIEIPALISLGELELEKGDTSKAGDFIRDALEVAGRGPYRLEQADAYNVLARIARVDGDKAAAAVSARKAFEAAWCDGPPYAYHWALETARTHLEALASLLPDLPAFDATKLSPLPRVNLNPMDEYWIDLSRIR